MPTKTELIDDIKSVAYNSGMPEHMVDMTVAAIQHKYPNRHIALIHLEAIHQHIQFLYRQLEKEEE